MFFIKPFRKAPSVRSSLGFMTISSRWAGVLFPGLTVLTRDLVVLQAMHKAYLELKAEKPGFGIKEFAAYKNRNLVEPRVEKFAQKLRPNEKSYSQKMTFWQRYGSIFQYYNFDKATKPYRSTKELQELIFGREDKSDFYQSKDPSYFRDKPHDNNRQASRKVRIHNSAWFRRYQSKVMNSDIDKAFSGDEPLSEWWLTGYDDLKPNHKDIELIHYSRKLEFCFVVWQTMFEASSILVHKNNWPGLAKIRPESNYTLPKKFYSKLSEIISNKWRDEELLISIVSISLSIQKSIISKWYKNFSTDVSKLVEDKFKEDEINLFNLYSSKLFELSAPAVTQNIHTVQDLMNISDDKILDSLLEVHQSYCQKQGKPDCFLVTSFKNSTPAIKLPSISAELTEGRMGLFGYRLYASKVFYEAVS